jgi:multidrug efflux system outer membrane protein
MRPFRFLLTALALTLPGCVLGPDYRRPDTAAQLPDGFKAPDGWQIARPADGDAKGDWWKNFRDSRLNGLMDQAMANNQSLRAAFLRVEQARTVVRAGTAGLLPSLSLDPSAYRERRSATVRTGEGGVPGRTTTNLALPLVLDYEVDLWGRLRRLLEAARAEAEASDADYHNVMLALQADLAANYFSLRALDREIEILREGIDLRKKSLNLNRKRLEAGDIDEVDVSRAETEVSSTESEVLGLLKTRAEFENALAVLSGAPSSDFSVSPAPLTAPPPAIPGALPADLLERRPDVAQAERVVQAENARIGVAKAAFYPSLRLGGRAGLESASLDKLFRADSRTWGLGPEISVPIFEGGKNKAELERSRFRYEETVASYRQTVLNAVREVDDALAGTSLLARQFEAQQRTVVSAARTVELSQQRYDAGLVAFFDVVDAQRTALDAQRTAARIQGTRHLATIALVKALGGDWK